MGTIAIEGIQLKGYHGVYPIERREGHTFQIDIYLEADLSRAMKTDKLEDTIDYASVYALVVEIMKEPVNLLEYLSASIADRILKEFSLVKSCRIKLSKLQPMTMDFCYRTFIELERSRSPQE
ncbi:MAG: dihydroneopterin aldolase [Bacteroidota bacterium]